MWLAIEGIIGAGKTTTAELIAGRSRLTTVIERSEQHPFLEAYYRNPPRYALETELAFMLLQVHPIRDVEKPTAIVSDYAPAKNLIFAGEVCSAEELQFLGGVERRLWADLPRPDLAVVLDVPSEACLTRIATRGRAYERQISTADLDRLRTGYLASLATLGTAAEVVALTGTETPDEVAARVMTLAGL
jgi:deoxyguanosine kinase